MLDLNEIDVRVLGALIEKEICTPEYYPMTLNGLTHACNQKSNRSPVMDLDEKVVLRTVDHLRQEKLAGMIHQASSRVPKYQHFLDERLNLNRAELVVLCELMLRGPQTIGELRGHCKRMHEFESLEDVQETMDRLVARNEGQMVRQLPRQSGRKEARYAQLLSGEPVMDESDYAPAAEPVRVTLEAENEKLDMLAEQVTNLEQQLKELREAFDAFRGQFE